MRKIKRWQKRSLLILVALILAVGCAWISDYIAHQFYKKTILTDGSEAYNVFGCYFSDRKIIIVGEDPQFVVDLPDFTATNIQISLREPASQDVYLQVFYASPGEWFSEEQSVKHVIPAGSREVILELPRKVYRYLRFDFEQEVAFQRIAVYDSEEPLLIDEHRVMLRRGLSFAVAFFPLLLLILILTRKRASKFDA